MRISDWSSDVCSSDLVVGNLPDDRILSIDIQPMLVDLGINVSFEITLRHQRSNGSSLLGRRCRLPCDSIVKPNSLTLNLADLMGVTVARARYIIYRGDKISEWIAVWFPLSRYNPHQLAQRKVTNIKQEL